MNPGTSAPRSPQGGFEHLQHALYGLLHASPRGAASRWVQGSIQALIVANIVAFVAQTLPALGEAHALAFARFENVSLALFSLEFLARLVACGVEPRYRGALRGRLRYALSPMALIDLLAIAPAYLPWLFGTDLRVLRAARLMRIFRVLKLGRYSRAVRALGLALASRKEQLLVTGFAMALLLTMASSVLYLAEREAQPEVFGSIPAAAWWGVTTLTTVGYGDATPVTPLGKLAAALFSIMGIGLFALPAGILGAAFVEHVHTEARCPHCGGPLGQRVSSSHEKGT